ncbi:hypothetical protein [Amycolatopsis sp. CB00013]|uniref:hypothetical protein n=1 Tax=Amycolatopsis sp. CB00013 TaxID=1703945 RepID=UPI000A918B50|nr:hypothetical protein [Amycolatopsis sp. CB00013]
MSGRHVLRGRANGGDEKVLVTWRNEADNVTLPRIGDVAAMPRPQEVGTTYVEHQYRALAHEQEALWSAEGEHGAQPHEAEAAGLDPAATAITFLLTEAEDEVRQTRLDHQHAVRTLLQQVKRSVGAKLRYWIGLPLFVFGDAASVASAAIINGDIVYIAIFLAVASGVAGVSSGLLGAELRGVRLAQARRRDPDSLTEDERLYQHFFAGSGGGTGVIKLVALVSLIVVALIAIGVGTLRASVEGGAAGMTFGLLAAATALASGLLAYSAYDDVAEFLEDLGKRSRKAQKRYLKLANSAALRQRPAALATAQSIKEEYAWRGQAAAQHMESLSWHIQVRNPAVLGHGFPAGEQGGVIGRRPRRGGAA